MSLQFKTLVRPEHLNPNHRLFGGYMLLWVDEYAYIAAMQDYPSAHFVTRGMDAAVFSHGVLDGAILTFTVTRQRTGFSSVTYEVVVTSLEIPSGEKNEVFRTHVTMCNTSPDGKKAQLPAPSLPNYSLDDQ